METIELTILKNLIHDEEYLRKVLPFLESDYFENPDQKVVFEEIKLFAVKYNCSITIEALAIEVSNRSDINESSFKDLSILIDRLSQQVSCEYNWLVNTTEKWCRDRAIYLALMESINIADGQNTKKSQDAIPSILQDALSVSFDNNIGHD